MKVAVIADATSTHTQRFLQWMADRGIDTLPVFETNPAIAKYKIEKFNPDLVHAIWLPTWGVYALSLGVRPLAITAMGSDLLQDTRFTNNDKIDELLESADLFMAYSEEILSHGIRRGADPKKSYVTPIGVDTSKFCNGYSPLWRRFHKTDKTKVLLSPRHMSEIYNHATLIAAMPLLIEKYGDISAVFLSTENGEPSYAELIADMIDKYKLNDSVFSNVKLPYIRMPQAYNACDAVISIPSTDGQSLTNLEAMACEKPVIATQCVTNRSTLPQKWLVNPHNVQDLVDTVISVLDDVAASKELLKRNREFVKKNYELDDTMNRIVELYKEII